MQLLHVRQSECEVNKSSEQSVIQAKLHLVEAEKQKTEAGKQKVEAEKLKLDADFEYPRVLLGASQIFAKLPLAPDVFSGLKNVATLRELSYL